jgi:hypothetical protein
MTSLVSHEPANRRTRESRTAAERHQRQRAVIVAALIACGALSACTSPEATRSRGQGPGGDVGNRTPIVKMHEGSDPFWKTPKRIPGEHPPLEPARQADRLSRP